MIRPVTCLSLITALGAGLYLYQEKHAAQLLDRDIMRTLKQADAGRERIGLLRAEWALLNEPERLGGLASSHLQLQSLQPAQFARLEDLPNRLPAVAPMPVAPPPVEEVPVAAAPAPTLVANAVAPHAATPATAAAAPVRTAALPPPVPVAARPAAIVPPPAPAAAPVLLAAAHPVPKPTAERADKPERTERHVLVAARPHEDLAPIPAVARGREELAGAAIAPSVSYMPPRSYAAAATSALPAPRPMYAPVMPAYAPAPVAIHAPTVQTASAVSAPQPVAPAPYVGSALGMARTMLAAPVPVASSYAPGR